MKAADMKRVNRVETMWWDERVSRWQIYRTKRPTAVHDRMRNDYEGRTWYCNDPRDGFTYEIIEVVESDGYKARKDREAKAKHAQAIERRARNLAARAATVA
jgi:hypothetical protein